MITSRQLLNDGLDQAELDAIDRRVCRELDEAIETARAAAPYGPSDRLDLFVYEPRPPRLEPEEPRDTDSFRTMDAVRESLTLSLEEDDRVFVAGVDVGRGGNVFALTRGLADRWPNRVLDTPISETAIMGMAIGAAMSGMRPVVELMYLDFLGVCMDQLLNQAAKLHFMTGGNAKLGLTIRTQYASGRSSGSQHSQSLEALLAHIPGLTVVMPSTPWETYGLLRAAILDPNPVVFIENRLLYGRKGPRPPTDLIVPIGKARVVRAGTSVTVVAYSAVLHTVCAAAKELGEEGIDVEVIDLRTIQPLDRETILTSLRKTNRLVVIHEAVRDYGVGAEIVALCADEGFWSLDAPLKRIASGFSPAPYAPELEREWLPSLQTIVAGIRETAQA